MVRSRSRLRPATLLAALAALAAVLAVFAPSPRAQAAPSPWSSYGMRLEPGASMPCRNYLESPNQLYALFLGCDAELRLYTPDGSSQLVYPSFGSAGTTSLTLRADGSLVLHWNGYPVWSTGPQSAPVQAATVTDDGRFGPLTRDWVTIPVVTAAAPPQLAQPVANLAAHLRTLQDVNGSCWRTTVPADATRGTAVTPCTGHAANWWFTRQLDGTWTVMNADTGLCLTARSPSVMSAVGGSACNGSSTQRWRVFRWIRPATGGDAYALVPAGGPLPLSSVIDPASSSLILTSRQVAAPLTLFTL